MSAYFLIHCFKFRFVELAVVWGTRPKIVLSMASNFLSLSVDTAALLLFGFVTATPITVIDVIVEVDEAGCIVLWVRVVFSSLGRALSMCNILPQAKSLHWVVECAAMLKNFKCSLPK